MRGESLIFELLVESAMTLFWVWSFGRQWLHLIVSTGAAYVNETIQPLRNPLSRIQWSDVEMLNTTGSWPCKWTKSALIHSLIHNLVVRCWNAHYNRYWLWRSNTGLLRTRLWDYHGDRANNYHIPSQFDANFLTLTYTSFVHGVRLCWLQIV